MSRAFSLLAGPEAVLAALTGVVLLYCARHMSYSAADVRAMERLIWLLPLVAVPLAFAAFHWTGVKSWGLLLRTNLAVVICLMVCAYRIVDGFGAPGTGPKGQDGGFLVILSLGLGFSALANAIYSSMILQAQHPAAADWFRTHTIVGPVLTVLAAAPILMVQAIVTGIVLGGVVMAWSAFQR